jgi:hypothetical protein
MDFKQKIYPSRVFGRVAWSGWSGRFRDAGFAREFNSPCPCESFGKSGEWMDG